MALICYLNHKAVATPNIIISRVDSSSIGPNNIIAYILYIGIRLREELVKEYIVILHRCIGRIVRYWKIKYIGRHKGKEDEF